MLSLLHSIQTHSLDISAPIAPFIVFAFAVSGQKCTLTSGKHVMHALAVRSPIWVVENHLSLCIIFWLKCPLAFCLWMHTRLAIIKALPSWNLSNTQTLRILHLQLWRLNCNLSCAIQLFWVRTASSLMHSKWHVTSFRSIDMFSLVVIATPWCPNKWIATSIKV